MTWIPGGVLMTRFLRLETNTALRVSLVFMTGLSLVSIATWLGAVLDASFSRFLVVLQWALVAFYVAAVFVDRRKISSAGGVGGAGSKRDAGGQPNHPTPRSVHLAYVVAAGALVVVTAVHLPQKHHGHETFDHVGYTRRVAAEDSLVPSGVLAPPVTVANDDTESDPRKGTLHVLAAAAARFAGVEPMAAWRFLSVFLYPLAFLNFVLFCAQFVPRWWLATACAPLFLLFQGGTGFEYAAGAARGQSVALLFYWILVPLCLEYSVSRGRKTLAGLLLILAGGGAMYLGVVLHFAVLAVTLVAFHRFLGLSLRGVATLFVCGVIATAVVAGWRIAGSHGESNIIHAHPQGLLFLGQHRFVMSPVELLRSQGLLFFGGLLLAPLALLGLKRSLHARRVVAFAAIPFAVCATPILTAFLSVSAAHVAFGSITNVPAYAAVTLVFWGASAWARGGGLPRKFVSAAVLFVWASAFLAPSVDALVGTAGETKPNAGVKAITDRYQDLFDFLRKLPVDSVVLSDPVTSCWIGAESDLRVVAVLAQHDNPKDAFVMDRLENTRNVLSPFVGSSRAVEACERYAVDYVVLNGRLQREKYEYLADWDPGWLPHTRSKLSALEPRFRVVFENQDVVVFRRNAQLAAGGKWSPLSPAIRFAAQGVSPCRVDAPGRDFQIREAGISPGRVLPGETVLLTIGYEKRDVSMYGLPVMVHVRFDHESIAPGGREAPGEKLVRRIQDRRAHRTSRFRYDHHPFDGWFTPDLWPIGSPFYEVIAVKLPPTLRKGRYNVELKAGTETMSPNFALRDFFFDRDHYSGTRCLELEVTDYTVR